MLQLIACATAWGAQPIPAAKYVLRLSGNEGTPTHEGVLQVADDGRALTSAAHVPFSPLGHGASASYLGVRLSCGRGYVDTIYFGIGAPRFTAARIGRRGTFGAVGRGNLQEGYPYDYWVRLRGRFVSTELAVVEIVDGRYSPGSRRCRIPHRTYYFKRAPSPQFSGCPSALGQTLAATPASLVFRSWGYDARGRTDYAYACLLDGLPIALGWLDRVSAFSLAGPYLAYAEWDYAPDDDAPTWWYLDVVDLRGRGRVVREVNDPIPDYKEVATLNYLWDTFASSAVTPLGSVAWVAYYCTEEAAGGACSKAGYDVWLYDGAGKRRVDQGNAIDPTSLAFHEQSITWSDGGETRSAPIDVAASGV